MKIGDEEWKEEFARRWEATQKAAAAGEAIYMSPQDIADFVTLRRAFLDFKQSALAYRAGVSLTTIQRIEAAKVVNKDSLRKVAVALDHDPETFIEPQVPLSAEQALAKMKKQAEYFEKFVRVDAWRISGIMQVSKLANTHFYRIEARDMEGEIKGDLAELREMLDFIAYVHSMGDPDSMLRPQNYKPRRLERRPLYREFLLRIKEIERQTKSVALGAVHTATTNAPRFPKMDIATIVFCPRATDPGASRRRFLLVEKEFDLIGLMREVKASAQAEDEGRPDSGVLDVSRESFALWSSFSKQKPG